MNRLGLSAILGRIRFLSELDVCVYGLRGQLCFSLKLDFFICKVDISDQYKTMSSFRWSLLPGAAPFQTPQQPHLVRTHGPGCWGWDPSSRTVLAREASGARQAEEWLD